MDRSLKVGDRGPDVGKLQQRLTLLGYSVPPTSFFDQPTSNAILAFKRDHRMDSSPDASPQLQKVLEQLTVQTQTGIPIAFADTPQTPFGKATLHVVVISTNESDSDLVRCLQQLDSTVGRAKIPWSLVAVATSENKVNVITQHSSKSAAKTKIIQSPRWVAGLNEAMRYCRQQPDFEVVYPIHAKDYIQDHFATRVWPLVSINKYQVAFFDWSKPDGFTVKAAVENPLMELVKLGAILFNYSVIPIDGDTFPEALDEHADAATWLHWYASGLKLTPVTGWSSVVVHPSTQEDDAAVWSAMRASIYSTSSALDVPKVSALMVTGRSSERYPLARVAVDCFLKQSWPNRELVIINHGDANVCSAKHPMIKELRVVKSAGVTLGDMRNWSRDAATGEWCIQWDDDDWHHPNRIRTQMACAKEKHVVSLVWQVRCAMTDNCAFYDRMPTGQQMTVLYERSTPCRYDSLEYREDTAFMASFGPRVVKIDNAITNLEADPVQYVRFYHGRNIWDYGHMMHGSDGKFKPAPGLVALSPYHAEMLAGILERYKSQPDFSLSFDHPGSPTQIFG